MYPISHHVPKYSYHVPMFLSLSARMSHNCKPCQVNCNSQTYKVSTMSEFQHIMKMFIP